jgi:hypothetical protein
MVGVARARVIDGSRTDVGVDIRPLTALGSGGRCSIAGVAVERRLPEFQGAEQASSITAHVTIAVDLNAVAMPHPAG